MLVMSARKYQVILEKSCQEKRRTWYLLFIKRTKKCGISHQPIPRKSAINTHQLSKLLKIVENTSISYNF